SAASASAQQVTYYNFNTPATASPQQYSYGCTPGSTSNPLFCFNYSGLYTDPSFIQDPASSATYAVQMTYPQTSQAASMWFSVPQNVANGFNVWFQFRITPASNAYATADGLAFVIQNALSSGTDGVTGCGSTGQGPSTLGGGGGCIGYGGIPNSVALEFDTYNNEPWDSADYGAESNYANHIALQSCGVNQGTPNANSPAHVGTGNCLVSLNGVSTLVSNPNTSGTSPSNSTAVTLADGNVHQVVIVYNGPLDTPANTIAVYLDPQYNEGTLTPVTGSHAIFTGPFDITQYMNLTNNDAYVGFTSGTGAAFETHELMAWTFTPHTTVTQTQPLNPPGTPTTFNFGTHSYTANFPSNVDTSNTTMGVIATTISPTNFTNLITAGPTQYAGSACQVYDDTGGNCIIYSTYCYPTGNPSEVEACPAVQNPPTDCTSNIDETNCILLTSSYDNSVQPMSPGYLQGDALFSPITSITGSGGTVTVTCTGECSVTQGQTVTIMYYPSGSSVLTQEPGFTGVTVTSASANQFTFGSTYTGTSSGGFVTSNNVEDIFTSYSPQSLDGSSTGKTTNLGSDFVVTGTTMIGTQTLLSAPNNNNNAIQNVAEELTATVGPSATEPAGLTLLSAESIPSTPPGSFTLLPGSTINGTVTFSDSNSGNSYVSTPIAACENVPLTAVTVSNVTTYQAQCNYTPPVTGTDTITAQYSDSPSYPYHQPSQNTLVLNVNPQTVQVMLGTAPAGLTYEVVGPTALTSGTYNTSQTLNWNVGTNYTLIVPNPLVPQTLTNTPNTQYLFSQWSNGGTATDVVTATTSTTGFTAQFTTQYQLSVTAGAGGMVSVPAGNGLFYNANSVQTVIATPNPGYVFSGWTGTGSGQLNSGIAPNTYNVTMSGPALITANFTAVPMATVSPLNINLGTLYLGAIVTKTITITNTGAATMTITDPRIAILPGTTIGNLSEFITLNLCPKTLAAGKSCVMTVTFIAGPFYGQQSAALTITDSAAGSPQTVMLTATVIDPQASFNPTSLSFGTEKVGTVTASKSITLSNPGGSTLSITNIAMTGTDETDYSITSNTCGSSYPVSLPAGKSCTLGISFKPGAKGTRTASLVVTDNTKSGSQSAALTGTGD
ncbi:MAG: choice-of-anchor D domain-containing protein, partial [Acidobacteriaceae bacterium]